MNNKRTANRQSMLGEVLEGLRQPQKRLPSKYFYDEKGSELFDQITYLEEYYLTRTERAILQDNIDEITSAIGSNAMIVEPGSGSSKKTRILLEELDEPAAYVPVDISGQFLLRVVNNLRMEYPRISIIPVFQDYTSEFDLPDLGGSYKHQVVFFPGSTIGNFRPAMARSFLKTIARSTDPDSSLLVGVDLKKDKKTLEVAYNDSQGLTAAFNKNILRRLNRELDADFDLDQFIHRAFYNEEEGRMEMHLVSQREQRVTVGGEQVTFDKGESIHTENSYKYSLEEFEEMVAGLYSVKKVWTDNQDYFSVQYLERT